MTIRLVTDSTCDLPAELVEQYNITVVPAYINFGDTSFKDGVDLSRAEFYQKLSDGAHPTTAAPSPAEFVGIYEQLAAEGATEILSIHISSELSAFLNHARLGAQDASVSVTCYDSRQVTMGLGLLVLVAARAIEAGKSLTEITTMLDARVPRTRVYAGVDTLEYLQRSGRVSGVSALIGSLLKIKPILEVKDGTAHPFERVRTRKKIPTKLAEILANQGDLEELAVLHINAEDRGRALMTQLNTHFPEGKPKTFGTVGPAVGAHAGPGTIGFACIAK